MRIASSATSCAASVAKSFAIPASRSARSPPSLRSRGLHDQQAGGLDLRRHLGELELHGLVLRDRLAERLALLRVADGSSNARLRDADAAGGDVDAAELDPAHEVLESLADACLAAEHARRRCPEAVEHELGRLDALVAELLQPGIGIVRPGLLRDLGLLLEDERRHAAVRRLGVGIGLREQHHDARAQPFVTHIFWPVIT